MEPGTSRRESGPLLNVFCVKEGDAWRVHLAPEWLPAELEGLFDYHGEAYPVLLDWEDLERQMHEQGAPFQAHMSHAGSVELTAEGAAAAALARWVAGSLASGIRSTDEHFEPAAG